MQSWGENAKWDAMRDTATMPTKSGIIGLLACCFGMRRGDPEIMELSHALKVSARADRSGEIRIDYHTVQGMPILHTADNGTRPQGQGIVSRRAYLEDASFLVVLSGDSDTLEKCAQALQNPVWSPYLGRKSCVPTLPVFLQITDDYATVEDAVREYPPVTRHDEVILAQLWDGSGEYQRNDEPVSFDERRFSARRVRYLSIRTKEE